MKKNVIFLGLATVLLTAIAAPKALADEVWATGEYDVVYEEDRNNTAIWSYGDNGTIFIDGLGGVITDRGSYNGYWTQETASVRCDTFREGANGEATYYWGRFEITFIDSEFPSRWHANFGLCDREPTIHLDGTPITADLNE